MMLIRWLWYQIYLSLILFISLESRSSINEEEKCVMLIERSFVFFDEDITSIIQSLSIDLVLVHTCPWNSQNKIFLRVSRKNILRYRERPIIIWLSYCQWSSSVRVTKNWDVHSCLHTNTISEPDPSVSFPSTDKSFLFKYLEILCYSPFWFLMQEVLEFLNSRRFSIPTREVSNDIENMLLLFCEHKKMIKKYIFRVYTVYIYSQIKIFFISSLSVMFFESNEMPRQNYFLRNAQE